MSNNWVLSIESMSIMTSMSRTIFFHAYKSVRDNYVGSDVHRAYEGYLWMMAHEDIIEVAKAISKDELCSIQIMDQPNQ